jgi:nicotinamide phosphoribosyltransferase
MPNKAQGIVVFGIQYVVKYVDSLYREHFFNVPKDLVCGEAKQFLSNYLNTDYDVSHFESLHDLGYLPIHIKTLDEGTIVGTKVPILTIYNTHPDFFWLPNFLETLISSLLWKPVHSASLAYAYKKILVDAALRTDKDNLWITDFQGHDFSFRGMQHPESAISSGLGFLTSFKGSDTVPALLAAKKYYNTDSAAYSVPASEHAVVTAFGKEDEIESFKRILEQFPKGIVSMVSDSFDLWEVLVEYLPSLKSVIMTRDGKLVIRGDSGDPVDIICGEFSKDKFTDLSTWYKKEDSPVNHPEFFEDSLLEEVRENTPHGEHGNTEWESTYQINGKLYKAKIHNIEWNRYDKQYYYIEMYEKAHITVEEVPIEPKHKGIVELLWDVFGGTVNEQGFKVLDSHVGAIYGDSITLERAEAICSRLEAKGFASTNTVLGVGSFSMGYATRDNQGGAIKATYCELDNGEVKRNIFKDPITDDGTKKSAKGLLRVDYNEEGKISLYDEQTWEQESTGLLTTVYLNGFIKKETTLDEIRKRLA